MITVLCCPSNQDLDLCNQHAPAEVTHVYNSAEIRPSSKFSLGKMKSSNVTFCQSYFHQSSNNFITNCYSFTYLCCQLFFEGEKYILVKCFVYYPELLIFFLIFFYRSTFKRLQKRLHLAHLNRTLQLLFIIKAICRI